MKDLMKNEKNFKDKVLEYNKWLSHIDIDLVANYKIINPFNSVNKEKVKDITKIFYNKYYNDNHKRYLILGSTPARRGSVVTGIPFYDANQLYKETGIIIDNYYINKNSTDFLDNVIDLYGGCEKFYQDFFMNFVCPLGIVNKNSKGQEINANYYENKQLENILSKFIVASLKKQISLGIDTSVCFCIGTGENFKFLTEINKRYNFFDKIIPLEHPRYIMQYNSKNKEKYLNKYLTAFNKINKFY